MYVLREGVAAALECAADLGTGRDNKTENLVNQNNNLLKYCFQQTIHILQNAWREDSGAPSPGVTGSRDPGASLRPGDIHPLRRRAGSGRTPRFPALASRIGRIATGVCQNRRLS